MTTTISAPKNGTKEAALVAALGGKGKTIKQFTTLLNWQPHTVRAAFTRLRKRGYLIERVLPTDKLAARFKLKAQSAKA